MSRKHATATSCSCGSGVAYQQCCNRWHGGAAAPTAEQLMRSRYTAFVIRNESYLLATWHYNTRPSQIDFELTQKWLGLKIVATHTDGDLATVEFIARYRLGGASAARQHEVSRFVREQGRWFYVDGKLPS